MFENLFGNNQVKEILRRMIRAQRVPRSLLLAGADGVGKKRFAIEIAKAFVCQNPVNFEACNRCSACVRASKFTFPKADDKDDFKKVIFSEHADVGIVAAYKNGILVDAVRDLEREANFRPFEAKARFFLIDDAEKLNSAKDNAANALLKTLEEPPETSYIFLVTSRPDMLLPTIRSRCQTVRFAPIPAKEIERFLLDSKAATAADAELLSRLSRGSLERALKIELGKFRERRDAMLKIPESILLKKDRAALLETAEEMNDAKNKDNYNEALEILEILIRDIWNLSLGAGEETIVNADIVNVLKKLAANAESKTLASWLTEIEKMRENFAVNINRKIAADALFMQMANVF